VIKKINAVKKLTHAHTNSMRQAFQYSIKLWLFDDRRLSINYIMLRLQYYFKKCLVYKLITLFDGMFDSGRILYVDETSSHSLTATYNIN